MEIQKETNVNGYADLIAYSTTKKILEQMEKYICKINVGKMQGTGFFCKIPILKKEIPVFITNNHIINEQILYKNNEKIEIYIEEDIKKKYIELDEKRIKYTDEKYDITIIEIKENDEIKNYLELDDIIMNDLLYDTNKTIQYENDTIYIIQYPKGKLSVSYGIIENIYKDKQYNFTHKCTTDYGSSGAPILNINNKIIGIHKEGYTNVSMNIGLFLNYPIKEFIKLYINNEYLLHFNIKYNYKIKLNSLKINISKNKFGDEGLKDFCKIEFKELKELYFDFNNISDIKVLEYAKFDKLKILFLRYNKISNINILEKVNFRELKELNLYYNNISDITILEKVNFSKLEILSLGKNEISDICVLEKVNFKDLKILDLSYNNISNIEIFEKVKFNKLESLLLNTNKISDISIFEKINFFELKKLNLNDNKISDIKILENVKFNKIEKLLLENNIISDINIVKNMKYNKLKELNLIGNKIQNIEEFENFKFIIFDDRQKSREKKIVFKGVQKLPNMNQKNEINDKENQSKQQKMKFVKDISKNEDLIDINKNNKGNINIIDNTDKNAEKKDNELKENNNNYNKPDNFMVKQKNIQDNNYINTLYYRPNKYNYQNYYDIDNIQINNRKDNISVPQKSIKIPINNNNKKIFEKNNPMPINATHKNNNKFSCKNNLQENKTKKSAEPHNIIYAKNIHANNTNNKHHINTNSNHNLIEKKINPNSVSRKKLINKINIINNNYLSNNNNKINNNKKIINNNSISKQKQISKNKDLCQPNKNNDILNYNCNINAINLNKNFNSHSNGLKKICDIFYLNPTLQCLANVEKLTTNLFINKKEIKSKKNSKKVTNYFLEILENLWEKNDINCFAPYIFKRIIIGMNPSLANKQQVDSKDFLLFIIEILHKELNTIDSYKDQYENNTEGNNFENIKDLQLFFKKNYNSIISDIFYGVINVQKYCPLCNNIAHNINYYNILIFPLEDVCKFKKRYSNKKVTLKECFEYYQKPDNIIDQNISQCKNCKQIVVKFEYMNTLLFGPKVIIINLNRSKEKKSYINVLFDEEIDLEEFIYYKNIYRYKLIGVISQESYSNDNVIAFAKSFVDNNWYKYDNSLVTSSNFNEVIATGIPHILFYSENQ